MYAHINWIRTWFLWHQVCITLFKWIRFELLNTTTFNQIQLSDDSFSPSCSQFLVHDLNFITVPADVPAPNHPGPLAGQKVRKKGSMRVHAMTKYFKFKKNFHTINLSIHLCTQVFKKHKRFWKKNHWFSMSSWFKGNLILKTSHVLGILDA